MRKRSWALVIAVAAGSFGACRNPVGLDLSGPVPTKTTATVTIRSSGFDPALVLLRPGGMLTFENQDGVPRRTVSDMCAELNSPLIAAGSKVSIRMPAVTMTCTYHDEVTPSFTGSVQLCSQIEGLFGPCR